MSIYRVQKNANYTVMNRTALNDTRLSWKAKGIIAYMLSMPDDWVFYITELVKHSTDGEKAFRSGLKELKDCGYVKRFPVHDENKKISHWETVIYETPNPDLLAQNLQVGNLQVEKLQVGNEALLSTESLPSTDNKLNTDNNIPYREIVEYLNLKTESKYKHTTKSTKNLIDARFNQGFTLDNFKKVIDNKTAEWLNDPNMSKYLRPETLFGNKFESYLNQKGGGQAERPEQNLLNKYNFDKERELKF